MWAVQVHTLNGKVGIHIWMCFLSKAAHHRAGILWVQLHSLRGGGVSVHTTDPGQLPDSGLDYPAFYSGLDYPAFCCCCFPSLLCASVSSFIKWDTCFFLAVEVRKRNNSLNTWNNKTQNNVSLQYLSENRNLHIIIKIQWYTSVAVSVHFPLPVVCYLSLPPSFLSSSLYPFSFSSPSSPSLLSCPVSPINKHLLMSHCLLDIILTIRSNHSIYVSMFFR